MQTQATQLLFNVLPGAELTKTLTHEPFPSPQKVIALAAVTTEARSMSSNNPSIPYPILPKKPMHRTAAFWNRFGRCKPP
jgi:hypothetical protein